MIATILDGLLPVAFVVMLGWFAGRLSVLKHDDAGVIATYVIRFALPFSLFVGASRTAPHDLLNFGLLGSIAIGLIGTYAAAMLVGRFAFRHDLRTSAIQALVCSFPDMAYFAAPVLAALFGPAGFLAVLLGNLVVMLVLLPATIILTQLGYPEAKQAGASVLRISVVSAVTNPIVWLPMFGVVLSFSGISLPHPLALSVDTVAKSAGGTSLFALGLMLYGEPVRINANVVANLALKNVLQPALMFGAAIILIAAGPFREHALFTGAAPAATATTMFALKNRVYTAEATSTVFASTVISIVMTAILIALVQP